MKYTVQRFKFNKHEPLWNSFIKQAKNSTFLFNRNFMDYHKERFCDHSLMIFNNNSKLVACLPANEIDKDTIASHSGLTYGAIILDFDLKLPIVIEVYKAILKYYYDIGFSTFILKAFPRIYNKIPSDEVDYCLFLSGAKLIRRDTAIVIDTLAPLSYSGNIRREAKKAKDDGVMIKEEKDFSAFWDKILIPNLKERFGVKPLHSLSEIELLHKRFPNDIKLFSARTKDQEIVAGTVFFETETVAHCQYISANDVGRSNGALNLLFLQLIDNTYKGKRYFDFGTANEDEGRKVNKGLLAWKERMGGRTVSHDFYEIDLASHKFFTF